MRLDFAQSRVLDFELDPVEVSVKPTIGTYDSDMLVAHDEAVAAAAAAATSEANAAAAETNAETAQAAAEAAQAAAEAVGSTNDTIMAAVASDTSSAFYGATAAIVAAEVPGDVTAALAADHTPADAAAAAVDAALADATIVTGYGDAYSGDPVVWSVVDEQDRRSWLEIATDGGPTANALNKMTPGIAAVIIPDAPLASGVAYAVVDQAGRLSEIVVGADGRVPQWVLDRWSSRLTLPVAADPVALTALPSNLSLAVGYEHRLYVKKAIAALSADQNVKITPYSDTDQLADYVTTTPAAATSYTMSWEVYDRALALVRSKSIATTVRAVASIPAHRLLPVGDSITYQETYHKESSAALGGRSVGTRTFDSGANANEGRPGWTLGLYMTQIGSATGGDSPFLFPVGVTGPKYLGNTATWAAVVAGPSSSNYAYYGFELAARGWVVGGPLLFNSSGYPVTPAEGDVVCDPSFGANKFRQYTSGSWVAMSPQPSVALDYAKYLARWSAAFTAQGGNPTQVSIMLGTNDFFTDMSDAALAAYMSSLASLIAMFRAVSSTLPIHVCCPPTGGPGDVWLTTATKFEFDARMRKLAAQIIATYDTPAQLAAHIHVVPFTSVVPDAEMTDWVHPTIPNGHRRLKPYLIGSLLKEGV